MEQVGLLPGIKQDDGTKDEPMKPARMKGSVSGKDCYSQVQVDRPLKCTKMNNI